MTLRSGIFFCTTWAILAAPACVNLPDAAGGGISGQISLSNQYAGYQGTVILQISDQQTLTSTVTYIRISTFNMAANFTVEGLNNGTYYVWAFADANNNAQFDLNPPTNDSNYSEIYGIYGPSGATLLSPNPYAIEIQNNKFAGINVSLAMQL